MACPLPLLLLGCAPQSGRCAHPHSHWVLALRVSPTQYHLYSLPPSTGTLSYQAVSSDELSQSLHPCSGCIVGSIPTSEASTLEQTLQSLAVPPSSPIPSPTPTSTSTVSRDEECLCHSRNARWADVLRSVRQMTNSDHIIIREGQEMRDEMDRRTVEWRSRTDSSSFVDWLASVTIDTTDADSGYNSDH